MEENRIVDYRRVFKDIWTQRRYYYRVLPSVFLISCLYIICIPRTYTSDAEIAPETGSSVGAGGALGSIASTLGFDLSSMESNDAITPMLYPDLFSDNGFIASLFSIKVRTIDGSINTDYYSYLNKYQKCPFWITFFNSIKSFFKSNDEESKGKFDPYNPSKRDSEIMENIRNMISLKVDKKTGAISVSVDDQDALVAKEIADSICERLQSFIIEYRTKKARTDMEYYQKLTLEAKQKYEQSRKKYSRVADADFDAVLVSVTSKKESLENEMSMNYTTYSTLNTQYQAARAKVQERTPAFMKVKGASVAIRPSSPKRMLFVLGMTFLAFLFTSFYILRKIILPEKEDN